ncbi:GNAT family N-acetyltransferase [Chloroflexi bacterium TSY]|nr:GNAT family N-acetyltransferase [Chloroflexi bacterium TSY]
MKENEQNNLPKPTTGSATVRLWHDKAKFMRAYFEHWLSNEAEDIAFLRLEPQSIAADSICISIHDESGNTLQTAFFIPNDQIILSSATDGAISALCSYLARQNLDVPGIFAPAPTSRLAAKMLERLTGKHYQLVKEVLHLELQQPPKSRLTDGVFQAAESRDFNDLVSHRTALQEESNTQRPFDSAQSVRSDLENGTLYKWVDNRDRIVASASLYHDRTPTSAYIDHVYVAPMVRRQGYASALVSKLCECAVEQGRVPRLSVDAVNQPAYQTYLKIGFVLAGRMDNIRAK